MKSNRVAGPEWTVGVVDEEGRIERPLPLEGPVFLPEVWLEGKGEDTGLRWRWEIIEERQRLAQKKGLLGAFVNLAGAPPEGYLRFAQRFGVLRLCIHGLPGTHVSPACEPLCIHGVPAIHAPDCYRTPFEPLGRWRHFARQIRAILNITSDLRLGKLGATADWATVYEEAPDLGQGAAPWWNRKTATGEPDLVADRMGVTDVVNEYLCLGGVRPRLWWWTSETSTITLDGAGVFGTLAVQLAFAVGTSSGVAICTACGHPYFLEPRERRPSRGKRNYCQQCRTAGEAKKDAGRQYWRRKHPPKTARDPEE